MLQQVTDSQVGLVSFVHQVRIAVKHFQNLMNESEESFSHMESHLHNLKNPAAKALGDTKYNEPISRPIRDRLKIWPKVSHIFWSPLGQRTSSIDF